MNILIVESELYLSHSISIKLGELGHVCTMCTSCNDVLKENTFDVVLLSTGIGEKEFNLIVTTYSTSIIIFLVSYVNHDVISKLLTSEGRDYIVKPFIMEHLISKIDHYLEYETLKAKHDFYEDYLSHTLPDVSDDINIDSDIELPLFVSTANQKAIDCFAYNYAKKYDTSFEFISLSNADSMKRIQNNDTNTLMYITDLHTLKTQHQETFFNAITSKRAIVANTCKMDILDFPVIQLDCKENILDTDDILSIVDYFKYIVQTYQASFSDTELSNKLGISRKSVWEKRKRYAIPRESK